MLSTIEKVLFLKTVDLFSRLPGQDLAQIAGIAHEISYRKGEELIREGEVGDALFLLVAGEVSVHCGPQEISKLGERQAVGEMAILDNEPRSASVTAVSPVHCLKVEREDFQELMGEKREIAHGIILVLTQRLREADRKIHPDAPLLRISGTARSD